MRDGPPRGGTRGGRDQFSWENVKNDAHRENYLGASVHAPVGRWQKGRDLLWYTRERGAAARAAPEIQDEQAEIRMREDALMREALGLPPPTAPQREPEKGPDRHRSGFQRAAAAAAAGAGAGAEASERGLFNCHVKLQLSC